MLVFIIIRIKTDLTKMFGLSGGGGWDIIVRSLQLSRFGSDYNGEMYIIIIFLARGINANN